MSGQGNRSRTVLISLAIAVLVLVGVAVALIPGILEKRRAEAEQERIAEILASGQASESDLRALAEELIPRCFEELAKTEREAHSHSVLRGLLRELWRLELLAPSQQGRVLAASSMISIHEHRRRFPVAERRLIFINTQGPWLDELGLATEGTLVLAIGDREVASYAYQGEHDRGGSWYEQETVDLRELCPDTGSYTLRATLRVASGEIHGQLVEQTSFEVVPGDWRSMVDLIDDDAADALVARAVDIAFGMFPDIGPALDTRADDLGVAHWITTSEPLPFWIWHSYRVELDGERLPIGGIAVIRPGAVKSLPQSNPGGSQGLSIRYSGLPPGRHTVTIRLLPDPQWLIGEIAGEAVPLYGGELVFERELIVAEP